MSSSRALDAAVAFPLLVVHVIVAVGGAGAVMLSGSGLDPCSYRPCGDPRWADLALDTVLVTAVALPVIDLLLIVVQLVRGRPAWPVPVVLCIVQVVVAVVCLVLVAQSGPL
ncbi:hypothetical protein [[Mycobacterium] wendilense]|uniref:Uncharacterized protein n=1 Tax=[Mycobacterium] wendilense TaxID=3064284 RepID=A0ABN9P5J1_9MYCO|nr:hypothetical protein [Mycolicibacterium sp. MU0050]CAJ1587578.1 hypothetical protein MU0050_004875 [Mycolicibacterium sp. MU0050]